MSAFRVEYKKGDGMAYGDKTAAELGRLIAGGKADPVAITEYFLDAAAASAECDVIYARMTPERALDGAKAAAARAKSGALLGPLDGVPVSWKDLFDTKGVATESGAALLKGRVPEADAVVLTHAGAAGTICLGKTHQTEFAFSGLGLNPNTATPPNCGLPGHAPGGSSSGAAASIAYGLALIAIGSDTGGSVRIPACWNSLVGLKTTHGLLSLEGAVPLCSGFDTVGPLTRTVEDAALMLAAMGGPESDLSDLPDAGSLSFAVVETIALDGCDAAQLDAFERAVDRIAAAGARIERVQSDAYPQSLELGALLFPYEAWQSWGELIAANPGVTYGPVEGRFMQGRKVTREQYDGAWRALAELRDAFFARFAAFDAILSPTVAQQPPAVDALLGDVDFFTQQNLLALRNTRFANLLGTCALTLPTATHAAGLQIMGKPMGEARLLRVGRALETIAAG